MFIRAQWSRFLDAHPEQVRRGVHALIAQGAATEETVPGIKGIGRVCRIFSRRIYRALGAEDIRQRRAASEAERALFVYVEPGHDTATALRSWGEAHLGLWRALSERGRSVEVVAVVRTLEEFARARTILGGWAEASGPAEPDAGIREEIARIERAILQGAIQILDEFGGLQAALKRSVALTKQARQQRGRGPIHTGRTWQTVRLSGAQFR